MVVVVVVVVRFSVVEGLGVGGQSRIRGTAGLERCRSYPRWNHVHCVFGLCTVNPRWNHVHCVFGLCTVPGCDRRCAAGVVTDSCCCVVVAVVVAVVGWLRTTRGRWGNGPADSVQPVLCAAGYDSPVYRADSGSFPERRGGKHHQ